MLSATVVQVDVPVTLSPIGLDAPDDHANTPGNNATPVYRDPASSSVTLDGVIDHINDADFFQYQVPAGSQLRFDSVTPSLLGNPSFMAVNSSGGPSLLAGDGSGVVLPSGLWYLGVSGNPSFQNGSYSVKLIVEPTFFDDHVDIWGPEATIVPPGPADTPLTFNGHLEHINDLDFFQFQVDQPTRLTLDWGTTNSGDQGEVTLFDTYGSPVFGTGPEAQQFATGYPLTAGQWYLRVGGNPSFQTGDYSVVGNLDDYPNSPSQVLLSNWQILTPNTNVTGRFETPGDIDVLRFDVSQASDLILSNPPGIEMVVTDSSGQVVTFAGDTARLGTGAYFVSLKSSANTVAGAVYSLTASLMPAYVEPVQIVGGIGPSIDFTPNLTWQPVEGAQSYEVFIGRTGESKAVFRQTGIKQTAFEVPVDLKDGNYTVWVKAKLSGNRQSLWGNGFPLLIGATPELTGPTAQRGEIAWLSVNGAQKYEIWFGTIDQKTGTRSRLMMASTSETSWEIPQSVSAGRYEVFVRAVGDTVKGATRYSRWNAGEIFTLRAAVSAPVINDWTVTTFVNPPTTGGIFRTSAAPDSGSGSVVVLSFNGVPDLFGGWSVDYAIDAHSVVTDEVNLTLIPPFNFGTAYEVRFIDANSGAVLLQHPMASIWSGNPAFIVMDPADIELLASHDYAVQTRISTSPFRPMYGVRLPSSVQRTSGWSTPYPVSLGTTLARPTSTTTTSTGRPILSWPTGTNRIVWSPVAMPSAGTSGAARPVFGRQDFKQFAPRYEVRILSSVTGQSIGANAIVSANQFAVPDRLTPAGYSASIRVLYEDGTVGAWSPEYRFKTASAPVVVTGGTESTVDATPSISWQAAANASTYEIWIGPKGSSKPTYRATGLKTTLHRVATPLPPGTYAVWVRAHLRNGGFTK